MRRGYRAEGLSNFYRDNICHTYYFSTAFNLIILLICQIIQVCLTFLLKENSTNDGSFVLLLAVLSIFFQSLLLVHQFINNEVKDYIKSAMKDRQIMYK